MWSSDLAPNDAMLAGLLVTSLLGLFMSTVHIRHFFAQIEISLGTGTHSLQLKQRRVGPLVVLATFEANKDTLRI